eukprot:scaffold80780_cov75-Phaeocystis_antarctica.AAC.2
MYAPPWRRHGRCVCTVDVDVRCVIDAWYVRGMCMCLHAVDGEVQGVGGQGHRQAKGVSKHARRKVAVPPGWG